ncbi:MAG: trigger factor [Candidatus Moranbacteria bacterium RIFOXYA12_FULL_35_19]|nr:MAG: Trigger factor [Candidatus Moranbacteria bacterium GW2011_GWF2_35_39]OGI32632.1 MAG: trigger factor [Candidatus Moranbacteria bacterium RIFOXYC12_FULL_36_13]OGI35075.1 MAG: trigger factor [Candidatus Moranbacteria bacterium RIFOXYA12_FULL_35_19]
MKNLPKSQIEFEVAIPCLEWEKYLEPAVEEASQELNIPGFRPGKAPRKIVEQKVGQGVILNGAAQKAIQKNYEDFVKKEKLEVIGSPKVEVLEISEGKDLKYKAVVSVMPKIKVEEKYTKGIKEINKEYKEKKPEVDEKELDLELEKLANSRVKLVTVAREAQKNDSVEIDFEVKIGGVPIENGTSKKHALIVGRGVFIPGFEEQIIGMKEGEEKEFELNFPADYHKKDLAGKLASFKVKVNLVQDRQTPEINDEFAVSLGNFSNLEALKKNMREGMEHETLHKMKDEKRVKYIEEIIKNSTVELPEILVHQEAQRMLQEFEYQLAPMGMNVDQYLAQIKKNKEELISDWEPQAKKRVISALALKELAKMENLEANSKEVEAEMNKTLQYYKNVKDMQKNIDMEGLYTYSKGVLENEKVFEYLEKL